MGRSKKSDELGNEKEASKPFPWIFLYRQTLTVETALQMEEYGMPRRSEIDSAMYGDETNVVDYWYLKYVGL